jgi:hypothetical protein
VTTHPTNPAASPANPGGAAVGIPAGGDQPTPGLMPPAGPRTWTIEMPPSTVLLTSNHRLHRMEAHKINTSLGDLAGQLARNQRIPRIERADILLTYLPPPRLVKDRHPLASARVEDSGALAPTGKALIDGLKDAGVFADDNFRHVRRESYELLEGSCPRGQVLLHITEVTP